MAQKKNKRCSMCQTLFTARRDAKTCSPTCRKRLQRTLRSSEANLSKKIRQVESRVSERLHRLAGGLVSRHIVFEPVSISDERGSIQAFPIKVDTGVDEAAKVEVRQSGQVYQPADQNPNQTTEQAKTQPAPVIQTQNNFADSTLPVVEQNLTSAYPTESPPQEPIDVTASYQQLEDDGYPHTYSRSIWTETADKFRHRWVILTALILLVLLPLGGGFLLLNSNGGNQGDNGSGGSGPLTLSKDGLNSSDVNKGDKFSVNLTLEAKNTLIISPTDKPQNLETGQIYLDQNTDKLLFYDGNKLHDLGASSTVVNNIQGPTNITNSTIINSSIQTGVTKLAGTADQINVSSGTGNVTLSLPQDIGTGSTPTFASLNLGSALQVAYGGTGATNFASHSLLLGNGSGAIQTTNVGSAGDCLVVNGSGVPAFQSCPGGGGVYAGLSQTPGYLTKFDTTTNQIVDSLLNESVGTVTVNGDLAIVGTISGDGSGLSALNASNISSGLLSDTRLSNNVTLQGNNFNGSNQLVKLTAGGLLPVLDGSNLTSVDASTFQGNNVSYFTNASNISTGTLNDLRLSSNVALLNNDNDFTGADLRHNGNDVCDSSNNCGYAVSSGSGNYIQNGTVAQTADFNITGNGTIGGTLQAGTINATTAIKLNGADINTNGTLSNVAYLAQDQTLSGHNIFRNGINSTSAFQIQNSAGNSNLFIADTSNNRIGIGTLGPGYRLDVQGGDINTSGIYRVNGAQISSADLSNDSNLAKITGANVFTNTNTFSGTVAIQGANSLTLGTSSNVGSIIFKDGASAFSGTLQLQGVLSGDVAFNLPASTGTQTLCTIELGNCAGSGTGVTSSGGTPGTLAIFTGSQSIGDSNITDDGSTVTVGVGQVIQGSAGLTIGDTGVNGQLTFTNSNNSNTLTLRSGATTSNLTFTLPTGDGSNGDCLKTNGSGALSFTGCTGGTGGGVTSINTLTGVLNVVGTANQITVSSAGDTITLALPQDINTSGNANFRTVTLTGQAAGDNLIVANAVSGATGNLLDLQVNGASKFTVDANGNANTTGQYQVNGAQISSADLSNDSNLAKLNGTGPQTFTGNNKFTGTFLAQNASDSSAAFQIQNSTGTSNLFVADTTDSRVGIGTASPGYTLDVNGDINTNGVYRINGVTICSSLGCTASGGSGDYIQNGTAPQAADFNVTGTGTVGGILTAGAGGKTAITINDSGAQNSGITIGGDTNLYRGAAGELDTDSALNVNGAYIFISGPGSEVGIYRDGYIQPVTTNATDLIFNSAVYGESFGRMSITADGSMYWGGGSAPSDTKLYRSAAGVLKTDGTFNAVTAYQLNGVNINTAGTLSNVAYLNASNNFSGTTNTFSATGGNSLAITGAPTNSATTSLIQIGSAIASGNTSANGGTYIGLNAPSSGAGSAADLINLQVNGSNRFKVDTAGNVNANGNIVVNTNSLTNGAFSKSYTAGTGGVSVNDVVVMANDSGNARVIDTTTPRDARVIGVAASTAGSGATFTVRILGSFQVTADTGAVSIGDQLVTSSTSGQVTVDNNATTGILGYATSTKSAGSSGLISVYIRPVGGQTNPNIPGNLTVQGTINTATLSGGTLTGSAVNSLNVSGTAISGTGALTINANGSNTVSIGGISTGDVLLAGGLGAAGCTVTNSNGNLTCDGAIATNATTGTQGWWTRSGTTLSPVNSGDAITTTGNISTTSSGTITSAGLLTGTAGATISGAATSINASSNFATNINTGTSTGAVSIGNSVAGAISLQSASTIGLTSGTTLSLTSTGANAINITPGGSSNTGVLVKPTTDSTAAFQIQNNAGTSNVFVADTTNTRIGIGTASPNTTLTVYNSNESTTQTDFTQALNKGGINIVTDFTDTAYTPGIFWSTQDNNSTKPKAGIYMYEDGSAGTSLLFGTSGSYSTGITNTALTLNSKGGAIFRNGSNDTAGFQVQNSSGAGLFTVNTSTGAALTSTLFIDTLGSSGSTSLCLNGSSQVSTCSVSAVTTVGTIDTQTKSSNGAVISGSSIYLQTADASNPGLVSTGTQTFAGAKTFNSNVTLGGDLLGSGSATGTTGTSSGTGGTNVTTITLASAGSFANGDVIFVDNTGGSGQDYYTRITAGGGTTTLTVSPAVSYGTAAGYTGNATITKYNTQNIGAVTSTNDYTTQSNRFFQGYFLGGVVTGAGSTTLSDGSLQSTTAMNFISPSYTFKNSSNSTSAFQIQNASAQTLFVADTANQQVAIGPAAVPANGILTIGTNTTAATGGIYFGTDTNLYRSTTSTLQTDSTLSVKSNLYATGQISTEQSSDNNTRAALNQTAGGASKPGILLGDGNAAPDVNLYRDSANILKTDDSLTVSGLLQGTAGLTITGGTASINASGTSNTSIGNATGTLTLTGSSSSSIVLGGSIVSATELNLLDGKDAALVDTNDAVNTALTGTGALGSGSIASGFGTIATLNTITGTTLNGTTGINTGAGAGTQRIDSSGNLLAIGNVTTAGASTFSTTGATGFIFKPGTDNTTAFQVQNATGSSLISVDSSNSNITLLGNNSGALATWQSNSPGLPVAWESPGTFTYNGYIYAVSGYAGAPTTNARYAKLNADGTIGSWTATTSIPQGRDVAGVLASNGYVYVIAGDNAGAHNEVYYAKLNADGTIGTWGSTTVLPQARYDLSVASLNGYIYAIGGNNAGAQSTVYYAKQNADGTVGSWNSANTITQARTGHSSAVANGYLYVIGGDNTSNNAQSTVYYAKLNGDGSLGSWGSTTSLSASCGPRVEHSSVVLNGYLYVLGGENNSGTAQSTVCYAQLNSDGTIGSWNTTSALLGNRTWTRATTANGYIYMPGGNDGSSSVSTIYYTSGSRLKVGGALDLVGLSGENLAEGGSGGELTAGNTNIIGTLQVQGTANFSQSVNIKGSLALGDDLSVAGNALFKNSSNSATAFQIQNSSGSSIFTADASTMTITINTLIVSNNLTIGGHIINSGSAPTRTIGATNNITGGTGASCTVTGTDTAGKIVFVAGTGTAITNVGTLCTINFNSSYGSAPYVTLGAGDVNGAKADPYVTSIGTGSFALANSFNLTASQTYTFYYTTNQ